MNKFTLAVTGAALLLACSATAADQTRKERRAERAERVQTKTDVDQRIRDINRLDNDASARLAGLRAVSHETSIPVPQLEAQYKEHPKAGVAGLLAAHQIALKGKRDVAQIYRAHAEGAAWTQIAKNNGVTLDDLDAKFSAVESAMKAGK